MSATETQTPLTTAHTRPLKLIDALNIVKSAPQQGVRPLDVFFVCGFTPLHLQTFLAAHLQLLCPDRHIQLHTGLYGDVIGNLERAATAAPDAVAVALEWPDFDARLGIRAIGNVTPSHDDLRESIWRQMQRIQEIIDRQLTDTTVALSLPSIGARAAGPQPGWLVNGLDAILLRCIADLTIWAAERKHIKLLNPQRLDARSPSNTRWDIRSELTAGFPYQLHHASILADLLSRFIRPPLPKKGLITDLDDTLWSGIVGEAGVEGISWSLERRSHPHALYQQQLREMANAGVLVAAASKNDAAIVSQAFARPDLLLDVNQIFPVEVSWGAKSAAVRRILQSWNVGPDSVVFVDDSPIELAEVHAAFPEIECLLFPKNDPAACMELLDQLRDMFGKHVISEEDTLRLGSIRVQASLNNDFLEDAQAEITFSAVKDPSDSRPLELINKTNQFNLNGRRYTESEWLSFLRDSKSHLLAARYKDKYGQLGKIAVLGARIDGDRAAVDLWVMSCRAFSRRIEHQCLRQLFGRFGVDEISFDFERTPRNTPFEEFFTGLLGAKPEGRCTLSRMSFEQKCPQLFHTLKEAQHE